MNSNKNTLSDEELIEGGIRQDSACLGALYSRYFQKVHQQCLRFVKDKQTAFDLTQDILLKAFSRLSTFRKRSDFSSWLWAIGNNHCKDFVRTVKQQALIALTEERTNTLTEAVEEDKRAELTKDTLRLLEHLPSDEKNLLILKYVHGTSVQELQHLYQLSESAVKMRLSRARKKLASVFKQKHPSLQPKKRSLPK